MCIRDRHQLFFDLRNRFGQTFVIVTHDEGLAQLTDRTIHLIDGEYNTTFVFPEAKKDKKFSGRKK